MTSLESVHSSVPHHFTASRERLDVSVLALSRDVGEVVTRTVAAYRDRDGAAAGTALEEARRIDVQGRRLDEECLKILALYRPTGRDLRALMATQKVVHDLVRVTDLAAKIGDLGADPAAREPGATPEGLGEAADRVRTMLDGAVGALVRRDVPAADRVFESEAPAAALRASILADVESRMGSHPGRVHSDLGTVAVVDALDRIARRAVNVAGGVVYLLQETNLRRVC